MEKNTVEKNKSFKPIFVQDEMSSSYLSYAMSVIVSRALPDVRDGLKPVHCTVFRQSFNFINHFTYWLRNNRFTRERGVRNTHPSK